MKASITRRGLFAALTGAAGAFAQTASTPPPVKLPLFAASMSKDEVSKAWKDAFNCDGVAVSYTLSYIPDPVRTAVYLNGLHLRLGFDYLLDGKQLVTPNACTKGDTLDVDGVGLFSV